VETGLGDRNEGSDELKRLAVVGRPLDEARVHEAPGAALGVDFHQHVGVLVVAGGGHDIVLRAIGVGEVDPLVHVAGDDELNGVLVLAQERLEAVVGELGGLVLDEGVVDEDEGGPVLLELGFEPVQLFLAEGADAGVEVGRGMVLGGAEEVIEVNEFVTLVVQDGVGIGVELGLEEAMAHLARDVLDVVVVVSEAEVDGHLEAVADGLCVVESGGVLEVEVVVGGGVVVEVVADEEDLLDGGAERVDEVAGGGEARRGDEDAFVVFDAVLAAFDVEVVDDVGVGDEGEVELVGGGGRADLLSPKFLGEQVSERGAGECCELSAIEHGSTSGVG
jgi:hypothetical protein